MSNDLIATGEDVPIDPVAALKEEGRYVPDIEGPEHRAMYSFYLSLGDKRTLSQVAKEFGKSTAFISNLSRAFQWRDRVQQALVEIKDPLVQETKQDVNTTRRRLVAVVDDLTETLVEITKISRQLKAAPDGQLTLVEATRLNTLRTALGVYGLEIDSPKKMNDLLTTLRDVVKFNQEAVRPGGRSLVGKVDKMQLIVKDD